MNIHKALAKLLMGEALVLFSCLLQPAAAQLVSAIEPVSAWIIGSYVNVHDGEDEQSIVIGHLTTNTPVQLVDEKDGHCAIKWGTHRTGFVACRFIANKPLTMQDIDNAMTSKSDLVRRDATLRAFWMEPSYRGLRAAGNVFEQTMLPASTLQKEAAQLKAWEPYRYSVDVPDKLKYFQRFPIPEFEAMKALAHAGMQPPKPEEPVYGSFGVQVSTTAMPKLNDQYTPVVKFLPLVKTARFKSSEEIGEMQSTTDQLSALFQIPYKVDFLNRPYAIASRYADPHVFGGWDFGDMALSLVRPVYDIGIYQDGHVVMMPTYLRQIDGPEPEIEMTAECGNFSIETHLRNESSVPYIVTNLPTQGLLLYFRSPKPINVDKAHIETTVHAAEQPFANLSYNQFNATFKKLTQTAITLNGDHSVDFMLFELQGTDYAAGEESPASESTMHAFLRYYFVNIDTDWKLLDTDLVGGCS